MYFVRVTLIIVGLIQIVNGAMYLAAPAAVTAVLGVLTPAPPWVGFILATAGARFVGYGIGMLAAARSPREHKLWIDTMIAIQALDVIATLWYSANGALPAGHIQAGTALPLLWVVLLGWIGVGMHRSPPPRQEQAAFDG
ncbi:hypothetical protein [Mycobacterium kyorinense]|uniref:Uncharacterized protein n=1 Tax=Mycobacterium kyorinense TaxID=487514 RepID=A0A1X1YAW5_9MYCO|nr:hypothetical protein [Mycobacterium kyorinense]ORW08171.1 hypothetical protein AWC14_01305 [Mycobacterium kyorinense]